MSKSALSLIRLRYNTIYFWELRLWRERKLELLPIFWRPCYKSIQRIDWLPPSCWIIDGFPRRCPSKIPVSVEHWRASFRSQERTETACRGHNRWRSDLMIAQKGHSSLEESLDWSHSQIDYNPITLLRRNSNSMIWQKGTRESAQVTIATPQLHNYGRQNIWLWTDLVVKSERYLFAGMGEIMEW